MSVRYAGVDAGGTKTHAAVFTETGQASGEWIVPTVPGNDGVVGSIVDALAGACRLAGVASADLAGVGVGIPGAVSPEAGVVRTAVNLDISECSLGETLTTVLGVPVRIENDVKAAALGAAAHLGRAHGDLAYLNVGTGVAAAVITAGRLVRGTGNVAGEIGHLPVDPDGPACNCGQRGCIETLCGGGQVGLRLAALGLALPELVPLAEGSAAAAEELDRIAGGIATAVQVLVLAHGSPVVALNGGVVHNCPGLVDRVRRELGNRAARSSFLAGLALAERIVVIPGDAPVATRGASLVGERAAPSLR